MTRFVTTNCGVGRLVDDLVVELLDVDAADLSEALGKVGSAGLASARVRARVSIAALKVKAPVIRPGKIWATGLNYAEHAIEVGRSTPDLPSVFMKAPSAVIGTGESIVLPDFAPDCVDFEGEVAVVIGRPGKNIEERDAWYYVAGITACNDVSARDVQFGGSGISDRSLAKSFDTFCPLGPCVVTPDEFENRSRIGIETLVNGVRRQSSDTSRLIFSVESLIANISRWTSLEPGDVISTGTPVGVGYPERRFLSPGDEVCVRVDKVGRLTNGVLGASDRRAS